MTSADSSTTPDTETAIEQDILRAFEEVKRPMSTIQIYSLCGSAGEQADVSMALRRLKDSGQVERRDNFGLVVWALPGMPEPTVQKPVAGAVRIEPRPAPPRPAIAVATPAPKVHSPAAVSQPTPAPPAASASRVTQIAPPPTQTRSDPTMKDTKQKILDFIASQAEPVAARQIAAKVGIESPRAGYLCKQLVAAGQLNSSGKFSAVRYFLGKAPKAAESTVEKASAKAVRKAGKPKRINGAHSLLDLANAPRFALWSSGELEIKATDQTLVLTPDALTSMLDFLVDRAPQLQKIFGKAA